MEETFEIPELSAAEIEGRLIAQRHALQWLLLHVAGQNADVGALLDDLNEKMASRRCAGGPRCGAGERFRHFFGRNS